jgi:hypothetical protein
MSTPPPAGTLVTLFDCWIGGLPTATFCRTRLFVADGNTTMPFEFPTAVFASIRLLSPDVMPMPKSTAAPVEYPLPLVSFHRSELLLPWIHMPPHVFVEVPFLTDTLPSRLTPEEVALMRIPDMQLVVVVTPCAQPRAVAMNRMPSPRKRWTTPGPRTPTFLCPLVLMPGSAPVDPPAQPVAGSFGPVIVNPLRLSVTSDTANAMHGAPVTWHVTSPTRREASESINVRTTVP